MAATLFLIALAAFLVSLIALWRPIRRIGLGTRKRALIASLVSGVVMAGGAAKIGAAAPIDESAPAVSVDGSTSQEALANVRAAHDRAIEAADHCAKAFQAIEVGAATPGASGQSLYPLASGAVARCRESSMAFDGMRSPEGVSRDNCKAFDATFRTCALAYAGHQRAAEALMHATDNGMQPSLVARFRQLGGEAATGKAICAAQIVQTTRGAGVEVSG